MSTWKSLRAALALAALAAVGACARPDSVPVLDNARAAVNAAETDPDVSESAAEELQRAREALAEAEATFEDRGDREPELLTHQAYLAERMAEIARTEARTAGFREEIESAEAERAEVLLAARNREIAEVERQAAQQAAEAERARQQALQERSRAESAEAQARAAAGAAAATAEEAENLRRQIEELRMQETERGLVLTLDEVLFDVDGDSIKPGADATLDRLANFLREYENRVVLVEGHTDSTGEASYNEGLSQRRANAVRDALTIRGIAADRIEARGLGESQPIASNSTIAGRQLNRRVEVVISDEQGRIPEAGAPSTSESQVRVAPEAAGSPVADVPLRCGPSARQRGIEDPECATIARPEPPGAVSAQPLTGGFARESGNGPNRNTSADDAPAPQSPR